MLDKRLTCWRHETWISSNKSYIPHSSVQLIMHIASASTLLVAACSLATAAVLALPLDLHSRQQPVYRSFAIMALGASVTGQPGNGFT